MGFRQEEYYTTIQNCNNRENSNEFIEFMLKTIDEMILSQKETTQEKIINLMKKNPSITQMEIAKAIDLTRDGISYHIKQLKAKRMIERVGSTKGEIWKVLK